MVASESGCVMAVLPVIITNGTTADANEVMADFNELATSIAPNNVKVANKTGAGRFVLETGATLTNPVIAGATFSGAVPQLVPIGTIIWFYDFNALVTFDSNYWRYCNGDVLAYPASPLNGQTLPDLSGRYIVGFGTDGGGDIGTAAWAVLPVGNANHQINIQHQHDMGNHTHGNGSLSFKVMTFSPVLGVIGNGAIAYFNYQSGGLGGGGDYYPSISYVPTGDPAQPNEDVFTYGGSGSTGAPSTNLTNNQLSSTQSIQPHSIRARALMRVL